MANYAEIFMNELYKNVKLKDISLYPQTSHDLNEAVIEYYLQLVYEVETDTEVREIIIPKVDLGLNSNSLPGLEINHFGVGTINEACIHLRHGETLPLHRTSVTCTDKNGDTVETQNAAWVEIVKREKPKKMTVEEIEKKLGYKVEIVSEK